MDNDRDGIPIVNPSTERQDLLSPSLFTRLIDRTLAGTITPNALNDFSI